MLVLDLESGYTRYSSLSLARGRLSIRTPSRLHDWKGRCCGTVQVVGREIMCNVLVLPVTSSPPRRPRDSTSGVNPSCLPTGAVESPRPSICLARKIHSGEVSIHPMTWAEDSREPMPWLPCPFGHGSLPFPEVDDDIEARAETAARTHVVTDPR